MTVSLNESNVPLDTRSMISQSRGYGADKPNLQHPISTQDTQTSEANKNQTIPLTPLTTTVQEMYSGYSRWTDSLGWKTIIIMLNQDTINRDEGSYQLSHAYDRFLDTASFSRVKNRKNWVPASSDEGLWQRPKRQFRYRYINWLCFDELL